MARIVKKKGKLRQKYLCVSEVSDNANCKKVHLRELFAQHIIFGLHYEVCVYKKMHILIDAKL
jgi:hypothetical protein